MIDPQASRGWPIHPTRRISIIDVTRQRPGDIYAVRSRRLIMTTSADRAQPWLDPVRPSRLRPVGSGQLLPDPLVRFAEFFAGIGLVRAALGPLGFQALWANDIQRVKKEQYIANHPEDGFVLEDVRKVEGRSLPHGLELLTSSFPCIDLSLAGNRGGLAGKHSGVFWEFARVVGELPMVPRMILIENVTGFASSHGGNDLQAALKELTSLGYSCDLLTIDARHFVPQSRPRMFIIGISGELPEGCHPGVPDLSDVRPQWIADAYRRNSAATLHYWELPSLPTGPRDLSAVVEEIDSGDDRWWEEPRLSAFLESLSPIQAARLHQLKQLPATYRTAYRRTRDGKPVWEMRRDGIAGCLRTTGGGSSKQALVVVGDGKVRVRWMTAREYARLMGASHYALDGVTDNQAQFGFGDAVVVDVIRWIGQHYLLPVLRPQSGY
jgi:DNA (cytosine-5)-methyltransferase 1